MKTREGPAGRLACVECGREQAAGERGWRAYLTVDEDESAETVVYCPDCAGRGFLSAQGESGR